ncbi:hypothetical protein ACFYKX_11785 [Cytobacillus sp. FJAT-54145]|uniref:Cobalamin biosynthesis protein CobT VWA domain-containing protein n=1 Tax=Cytobacillus spartinae TaxID=3299023 RepID=A0ABW6KDG4_9BACI
MNINININQKAEFLLGQTLTPTQSEYLMKAQIEGLESFYKAVEVLYATIAKPQKKVDNQKDYRILLSGAFRARSERFLRATTGDYSNKLILKEIGKVCTDGKTVWADPRSQFLAGFPLVQKIMGVRGQIYHEAAHILYTDFSPLKKWQNEWPRLSAEDRFRITQKKSFLNIVEDAAIELALCTEFPGAAPYIRFLNETAMNQYPMLEEFEAKNNAIKVFQVAMNMHGCVGYVKGNAQNPEIASIIEKGIPIMEKGRRARTTKDRLVCAEELYALCEPFIEEEIRLGNLMFDLFESMKGSMDPNALGQARPMPVDPTEFRKPVKMPNQNKQQDPQNQDPSQDPSESDDKSSQESSSSSDTQESDAQESSDSESSSSEGSSSDASEQEGDEEGEGSENGDGESSSSDASSDEESEGSGNGSSDESSDEEESENGSGTGDDSDEESEESDDDSEGSSSGDSDSEDDESASESGSQNDAVSKSNQNTSSDDSNGKRPEGESDDPSSSPELSDEEIEEMERQLQEEMENLMNEISEEMEEIMSDVEKEEEAAKKAEQRANKIKEYLKTVKYSDNHKHCSMNVDSPTASPIFSQDELKSRYKELFEPIKPVTRNLTKNLKNAIKYNLDQKHYGLTSGKIAQNQLYRKDQKIYYQQIDKSDEADLVIEVLVDESGSMRDYGRYMHAIRACIMMAEVCQSLKIPFAVTGHDAVNGRPQTRINHYIRFEKPIAEQKQNVCKIYPRHNTREGMSLKYAGEYLAQQPQKDKLLLVISDGDPFHNDGSGYFMETRAQLDAAAVVEDLQKKYGITTVGIAIGDGQDAIASIYKNFISVNNLEGLPKKLVKILEKRLFKN